MELVKTERKLTVSDQQQKKSFAQNDIIQHDNWAQSALGTAISLFHSQKLSDNIRPLLWLGGVHGDEPEGVHLSHLALNHLNQNPENINSQLPWLLIPCLNPDGINKNERTNGNGVDLNRNFPAEDWSTDHSKPRYFPGPSPGSEPEVKALVNLIEKHNPFLIVHCHAFTPSLTYTGDTAKKYCDWLNLNLNYEIQPDIGYPTPGSLGQYGWLNHKIPVICIEVEEGSSNDKIDQLFTSGVINFFNQLRLEV